MKKLLLFSLVPISTILLIISCKKSDPKPKAPVNPFTESLALIPGGYIIDNDTYIQSKGMNGYQFIRMKFIAAEPSYTQIGYDTYVLHVSNKSDFTDTVKVLTGQNLIYHHYPRESFINTSDVTKDFIRSEPYYWRIVHMQRMLSTKPMKFYIK